jgi:chromosome segregation ATPase
VSKTEDEIAALKAATREAHEAVQALKDARREAQAMLDQLQPGIHKRLSQEVDAGLAQYREALETAIKNATTAVFKRFDTVAELILGEDRKSRKAGKPSLEEMLAARDVAARIHRDGR